MIWSLFLNLFLTWSGKLTAKI